MPFPKLFSDAQILRLYEEYRSQDKDLKTFLREKGLENHYLAIRKRFDEMEKREAKGLPPVRLKLSTPRNIDEIAQEQVAAELASQTAKEASDTARWKFILGDKLWRLYTDYAARQGWDISKIAEHPIDEVFTEALRKSEEYPKLKKRLKELEEQVAMYEERLNPDIRLERGVEMLANAFIIDRIYSMFGIDFIQSKAGKRYLTFIDKYLGGVEIE